MRRLQASTFELNALRGQITFPDLRLRVGNFELKPDAPAVIELAKGTAQVKQFTLAGPDSKLALSGTVQLGDPGKIDLRLTWAKRSAVPPGRAFEDRDRERRRVAGGVRRSRPDDARGRRVGGCRAAPGVETLIGAPVCPLCGRAERR